MASKIHIKIRNYERFKGRKDVEHNSWFRCSNRLLEDPDFFDFTHEEILVWIYVLSVASQKNSGDIQLSVQHANQVCRLSTTAINSAVKKLKEIKAIEVPRTRTERGRYADDTQTCATNKQTDKQDITEQDTTSAERTQPSAYPSPVFQDPLILEFMNKVASKVQEAWLNTYQDRAWIEHQLKEAVTWIHGNPTKAPKSAYAKFFSSWLSRSWEWKRKNNQKAVKSGIEIWAEQQKDSEI